MRIHRVQATDFLGLSRLDLAFEDPHTTLTGPNGVGKTTVLTVCALARATVDEDRWDAEQGDWTGAGHRGSDSFQFSVGISFDQDREHDVIDAFFRAAFLGLLHLDGPQGHRIVDAALDQWDRNPAQAMYCGELVVTFDNSRRDRWHAGWEFEVAEGHATATLLGPRLSSLRGGKLDGDQHITWVPELAPSTNDIADLIASGEVSVALADAVSGRWFDFLVEPSNLGHEPSDIAQVLDLVPRPTGQGHRIKFRDILHRLFTEQIVITPNRRHTAKTFFEIEPPRDVWRLH